VKAEGIVYPSFAFSERQFRKAARRAVHSTIAFRCDDGLVEVRPLFERAPHFVDLIEAGPDESAFTALRRNDAIGGPLALPAFQEAVRRQLGRAATSAKRGRKPKASRREAG
jgi:hypothetical protein